MNKHHPASLSIVIPCHNEQEVLAVTHARLTELSAVWKQQGLISDYELVFVNNGSTDNTLSELLNLHEKDKTVVVIDLRKNFGFQGSISAGLFAARNDMVVSIDADLQDDPTKIADMVRKYDVGFEMVLGVRTERDVDSFFKRWTAHTFYTLLNRLGVASVYNHADFRLLSQGVVRELERFPERVRYLRSLIFEIEPTYACVYYTRRQRTLGKSKFNLSQLVSLAFDGITSFSTLPIRLVSLMGIILFLLSIVGLLFVLFVKYFSVYDVPGWAFLSIIIFFFGGLQSLSMGIIGEYISKLYVEAKQRPLYIVRKEYRHGIYPAP